MKVCYLSSTELGKEMFQFLSTLNCEISFYNLENKRITDFEDIDYQLGISFLYTYKIPESEFKENKVWVNFHPGPLPEYRGRNLCYHAIMEGATEFGATIHYMDADFDTGHIIKVIRFPIEPYRTAGDLNILAKQALIDLFKQYIPSVLNGEKIDAFEQVKDGRYYRQSVINEEIEFTTDQQKKVKALTVSPRFYPHTFVNGKKYLIIPEEDLRIFSK